jgi:hypothetical protein
MKTKFLMGLSLLLCVTAMVWTQTPIKVPGVGQKGQGAGMTIGNLDENPRPEIILMAYVQYPEKPSTFNYKIGWNVDTNGVAASWSNNKQIPGIGLEEQGMGVTLAQLDNNPRPEMIVMANYFHEWNPYRYRIGWNLDTRGETSCWDKDYIEVFGVGMHSAGADVAVAQLDDNPKPELIMMIYDYPESSFNFFRYRVGWNLDANGKATTWSNYKEILGPGGNGSGTGLAVTQLDNNPRPEIIFMSYDGPQDIHGTQDQPQFISCRVGWNVKTNGCVESWNDSNYLELPGLGPEVEARGAGFAVFNLDAKANPDFIFMVYANEGEESAFYYQIVKDKVPAKQIYLEMDKLNSVKWPPGSVERRGASHSLQGAFALAGIHLQEVRDDDAIPDIKNGKPYTDAEIHSFITSYRNDRVPVDTWHMYGGLLTSHINGLQGITVNRGQQKGFVVFAHQCTDNAQYLRTTAHQIGHTLNLKDSDGDGWHGEHYYYLTGVKGQSLMNPLWKLAADWNFSWSSASLHHFYHHLLNRWQPLIKDKAETFVHCH